MKFYFQFTGGLRVVVVLGVGFISACISPPLLKEPNVLEGAELRVVSARARGNEYVQSLQLDRAEVEFRKVLQMEPNLAGAYNDLGFALLGQNRIREALLFLEVARKMAPESTVIRDNIARGYYSSQDYERAISEYEDLLNEHLRSVVQKTAVPPESGERSPLLTSEQVTTLYRNMSIAHYVLGNVDEAFCYAELALRESGARYDKARLARFYMSLNDVTSAAGMLRGIIESNPKSPPWLYLDFGISLYALDDFRRAREVFQRTILQPGVSLFESGLSAVSAFLIEHRLELKPGADLDFSEQERERVREILSEYSGLCKSVSVDPDNYWPVRFADDIHHILEKYCPDED